MAIAVLNRSPWVVASVVILIGALALTGPTNAQTPEAIETTATRSAEQTEVAGLRETIAWYETEIAVLTNPTATSTPEPTATVVPPANVGETLPLGEAWEIQVVGMTMAPTWNEEIADGQFARVQLLITNLSETRERFAFDDLILRDATGRVFVPDREVGFDLAAGWIDRFDPNIPTDGFIVFDVTADATGPFILESVVDPTFRVLVPVEVRG